MHKWSKVFEGMSVTEVQELLGPPDNIWRPGEAVQNLLYNWRNHWPLWEYDDPMKKCILHVDGDAPFVRLRCGLDDLRLLGPSGKYFHVRDQGTVHSIDQFRERDVQ